MHARLYSLRLYGMACRYIRIGLLGIIGMHRAAIRVKGHRAHPSIAPPRRTLNRRVLMRAL